jgi:hypothetical protein
MSRPDLAAEMFAAAMAIQIRHLEALEALGVPRRTSCEATRRGALGVARVSDADDGLYSLGEGDPHLILPVFDDGELVDLCAFRSANPEHWLLRTGCGWALGLERGLGVHSWGDPVPIAVSPLDWLRQDTAGLCVVDWTAPELSYLLELPHIVCASGALASRLRVTLTKPVRVPEISVGGMKLAA